MAVALNRDSVENEVSIALDALFNDLDFRAQRQGVKPSELALMLDQSSWGLGDDYREWFESSGDEFV